MDRLEVELAGEEEVRVVELRIRVECRLQRMAHGVLHEAGLQVRVLDDEQLVRALEELVHRGAHGALDDVDQVLRVDACFGADKERALPALVVSRERDELEDAVDVAVGEARFEQAICGGAAYEPLRARARVDAPRLHADDSPDALRRRSGDPDQGRDLLGRQPRHGRAPLEGVLRLDADLGAERVLALDDVPCDVLCERLDEEGLADHDLVDRLAEDFGKPRHVDALLGRIEIDRAGDFGGEGLLAAVVADPDRLLDAGHSRAAQSDPHVGRRRLEIDDRFVPSFRHRV